MTENITDTDPDAQLSFSDLERLKTAIETLGLTDDPIEKIHIQVWFGDAPADESTESSGSPDTMKGDVPEPDGEETTTTLKGEMPESAIKSDRYDPERGEWVCPDCGKGFDSSSALGGHSSVHS